MYVLCRASSSETVTVAIFFLHFHSSRKHSATSCLSFLRNSEQSIPRIEDFFGKLLEGNFLKGMLLMRTRAAAFDGCESHDEENAVTIQKLETAYPRL